MPQRRGAATRRRLAEQSATIAEAAQHSMSNTPNCGPTGGASGEPDPIFASIERHRAASRGWQTAYDRLAEKSGDCIDAPERIEANTAFLAANEELGKALEAVLSSPPTTIAGVADLFDYVGSQPLALPYAFLPMIAATLPRGATGGPDPIFAAIERASGCSAWLGSRKGSALAPATNNPRGPAPLGI
jgi:hypothetical protein